MLEGILAGLAGLTSGSQFLLTQGGPNVIMLVVGGVLIYLGVKKDVGPLPLVPIGFGCVLVNVPLSDLFDDGGLLKTFYQFGIANAVFPLLIFIGIGAMTDFGPLLEDPKILLFGAAGQVGIFVTLMLALALGFPHLEAVSIAIIGTCDGQTDIFV